MSELPCDSEPHGEDAAAALAAAITSGLSAGAPNLGRVWSPGEGVRHMTDEPAIDAWPQRAARQRADLADRRMERAVREFCAAFSIPVPIDLKRAARAFAELRLNGPG